MNRRPARTVAILVITAANLLPCFAANDDPQEMVVFDSAGKTATREPPSSSAKRLTGG